MSAIPSAHHRVPSLASAASLFLAVALTAGTAAAQNKPSSAPQARPAPGKLAGKEAPPTAITDYLIGAGDVLQIFVWKEPELTREVSVRIDGKITVPLLGDVQAAGRSPQQLGTELGRDLAKFLESPQVTLGVKQTISSRFYVIGQVGRAGDYPLLAQVNVLQALALAGGFKEYAKTDEIVIIREGAGKESVLAVNYKKLETGKDMSQNVPLRPGDVIIVP